MYLAAKYVVNLQKYTVVKIGYFVHEYTYLLYNTISGSQIACDSIQSVPYHIRLSPSFNAGINPKYSKNLYFP